MVVMSRISVVPVMEVMSTIIIVMLVMLVIALHPRPLATPGLSKKPLRSSREASRLHAHTSVPFLKGLFA